MNEFSGKQSAETTTENASHSGDAVPLPRSDPVLFANGTSDNTPAHISLAASETASTSMPENTSSNAPEAPALSSAHQNDAVVEIEWLRYIRWNRFFYYLVLVISVLCVITVGVCIVVLALLAGEPITSFKTIAELLLDVIGGSIGIGGYYRKVHEDMQHIQSQLSRAREYNQRVSDISHLIGSVTNGPPKDEFILRIMKDIWEDFHKNVR